MRVMLIPGLIFGTALLATDARAQYTSEASFYDESARKEVLEQQLAEPKIGKDEAGSKEGDGNTTIGDTTSSADSEMTSPK